MHVRRVAGQQDPSLAVGRGLPSHIGEPGDPGGAVDPVIGPVYGDERLAEIAQGGFGRGADVLFSHQDADPPPASNLLREWMPRAARRMPHSGRPSVTAP